MTIHVSKDAENAINAAVQSGQFASADEMVDRLVQEYAQRHRQQAQPTPSTASQQATAPAHKPIWERILERTAAIPDEEWAKLPVDGAEQHDHYIYGTPKRPRQ
jgi:Arc/MetJ-type ribon-helix-helix transcriptional regulator